MRIPRIPRIARFIGATVIATSAASCLPEDIKVRALIPFCVVTPPVMQLIPGRETAIYGAWHCHYDWLRKALVRQGITNHTPDCEVYGFEEPPTADGHYIEHLSRKQHSQDAKARASDICKSWLSDLVLENYRREQEGRPIIPVLFCVDTTRNHYPSSALPSQIVPREIGFVTANELRRCYRLIHHPDTRIRAIAKKTLQFFYIEQVRRGLLVELSLKPVPSPWEDPSWNPLWQQRVKTKKQFPSAHNLDWRKELSEALSQPRPSPAYSPNATRSNTTEHLTRCL